VRNAARFLIPAILLILTAAPAIAAGHWREDQTLVPEKSVENDLAGYSAAITDNTLFLGAVNRCAVHVFQKSGGAWLEQGWLVASDGSASEEFGKSVSADGGLAVVGCPGDDIMSWNSGSAYVFTSGEGGWRETAKLVPSDTFQLDNFGCSVAVSGNKIIAGAKYDDDMGHSSGSAYLFELQDGQWVEAAKLVAEDGAEGDLAGWAVALEGNTAVVGAWARQTEVLFGGAVYVYEKLGGQWTQTATLTAPQPLAEAYFGVSVAVDRNFIAVGATGEEGRRGAVYLFRRSAGEWRFERRLTGSGTGSGDEYGNALALDDGRLLVAAHRRDGRRGGAFLYEQRGSFWLETGPLAPSGAASGEQAGWAVALSGRELLLGCPFDDPHGASSGSGILFEQGLLADFGPAGGR
jgi:hypothetical protein